MERQQIKSSSIASAGYNKETRVLEIEFTSKAVYAYKDVPPETWRRFLDAESKGRFFAVDIRACYEFDCIYRPSRPAQEKTHGESEKTVAPKSKAQAAPAKKKVIS